MSETISVIVALGNTPFAFSFMGTLRDDSRFVLHAIYDDFGALSRDLEREDTPPDVILVSEGLKVSSLLDAVSELSMYATRVIALLDQRSTLTPDELTRAGALHVEHFDFSHTFEDALAQKILGRVEMMSKVRVMSRKARAPSSPATKKTHSLTQLFMRIEDVKNKTESGDFEPAFTADSGTTQSKSRFDLIGIASSTGGLEALESVIRGLPMEFSTPIVLVQHIGTGRDTDFSRELGQHTSMQVVLLNKDTQVKRGRIYVAPSGKHVTVTHGPFLRLTEDQTALYCPSADMLFESMATTLGPRGLGVVLTGMGDDGARGLAALRSAGGHTLVQNRETSKIFGMPKAAIDRGGATEILPLHEIWPRLRTLCSS